MWSFGGAGELQPVQAARLLRESASGVFLLLRLRVPLRSLCDALTQTASPGRRTASMATGDPTPVPATRKRFEPSTT